MINVKDRVVQYPHRYKLVPVSGQDSTYDMVAVPGTVSETGTAINRALLLATQGFYGNQTVFNPDGSITETNPDGNTKVTVFDDVNDKIVETFTAGTYIAVKTTTFNPDGTITEVIS